MCHFCTRKQPEPITAVFGLRREEDVTGVVPTKPHRLRGEGMANSFARL